jgi:hypothetical protein
MGEVGHCGSYRRSALKPRAIGGRGANIGTAPGRRNGAAAGPEKMVSRETGRDVSRETFLRKRRGTDLKTRKMQNNPMHQKICQ